MTKVVTQAIELIRKRPMMFIGSKSHRGLQEMLSFFFDDLKTLDSAEIRISIEFKKENWIRIEAQKVNSILLIESIHKLAEEPRFFHVVGLPVLIALSNEINLSIQSPVSLVVVQAKKGMYESFTSTASSKEEKIALECQIDTDILSEYVYNYEVINQFIRKYVLINSNYTIKCIDSTQPENQIAVFKYPRGITHLLDYQIGIQLYGHSIFRFERKTTIANHSYQFCFSYQDLWLAQPYITTYANTDEMILGGSLVEGILDGITLAIQTVAKKGKLEVNITRRKAKQQLLLIAVVKGENFVFGGSVRGNLEMPDMRAAVKQFISNELLLQLEGQPDQAKALLNKFIKEEE